MAFVAETVRYVALFLLASSVLGIVYLVVAIVATSAFARRRVDPDSDWPPSITVLIPVCGFEAGLHETLASFCDQQYAGEYEVIFCLHDAADSALPVVRATIAAFPAGAARVAVGGDAAHRNPKIANLSKGAAAARGEIVVIADGDVCVGRDYLRSLAASFTSEHTGAVTCLYRGMPGPGAIAQLGAAYVEEQFSPSVLVAIALGRLRFCLGATMAVRRAVLEAIGGLDILGPFLADDHKLGELVATHGFDVVLSRYVVATSILETTLRQLWAHELRWARTSFNRAPLGYAFSFLIYAFPLSLLYLIVSRNVVTGAVLVGAALALRLMLHYVARAALDVRRPDAPWLVPLRDLLSAATWAASLFGRSVRWRDDVVTVELDGQLAR